VAATQLAMTATLGQTGKTAPSFPSRFGGGEKEEEEDELELSIEQPTREKPTGEKREETSQREEACCRLIYIGKTARHCHLCQSSAHPH